MNFSAAHVKALTWHIFAVVLFQPVDTKSKQNSSSVVFDNNYFSLNDHFVLSASWLLMA